MTKRYWTGWAAVVCALVSFAIQYDMFFVGHDIPSGLNGGATLIFGFAWIGFIIVSVLRYGRSGLWPLLAAPFVLMTPMIMALLVVSCFISANSCP